MCSVGFIGHVSVANDEIMMLMMMMMLCVWVVCSDVNVAVETRLKCCISKSPNRDNDVKVEAWQPCETSQLLSSSPFLSAQEQTLRSKTITSRI